MTKKVPKRMCCGCLEMFEKKELVRIVKSGDGEISLDVTGKKNGRGAYICKNISCLKKAIKSKKIERSLSCSIDEELYDKLLKEFDNS